MSAQTATAPWSRRINRTARCIFMLKAWRSGGNTTVPLLIFPTHNLVSRGGSEAAPALDHRPPHAGEKRSKSIRGFSPRMLLREFSDWVRWAMRLLVVTAEAEILSGCNRVNAAGGRGSARAMNVVAGRAFHRLVHAL